MTTGMLLAEKLRNNYPELRVITNCGAGSLKSQFKKADKSGAQLALILGEDELENDTITIKFLRQEQPQTTINRADIVDFIQKQLITA